ncbi:MAG: DegV family protein [Clostridiales bacterium]|nr:DegV family protein [Clostridiales bacterium]
MVRIVADTSTMYSTAQAREAGFDVAPLSVTIAGKSYKELDEIQLDEFVRIIGQGHMPVSSQPALGDVIAMYEGCGNDEVINLSMADGLSGTYSTAVAAVQNVENDKIDVVNTGTLCGPHRYMVEVATKMAHAGATKQEILNRVHALMDTDLSFLIPSDFDYLRRGGRLSPLVSLVGKTIKLAPVLTQSKDGRQLVMSTVSRSFKLAIKHVAKELHAWGVEKGWRIYVVHAAAPGLAESARAQLIEAFPEATLEILPLTPVFTTQGGPGCVAIQVVKEI